MDFERLKQMGPFSDAMLNRIIAFQEKQHPAWDESASFDERIKDLPLHALVFSNPDRNPETHRHTVAPFYPLRSELRRIAAFIKKLNVTHPRTVEFECGNGFVGSLLGREGVKVEGLRGKDYKPNQLESFYDPEVFALIEDDDDFIETGVDVALSVWMPSSVNLTPTMLATKPKLVIYMYTDHEHEGVSQTGLPEAFTDLPANYKLIEDWSITRPADLFHEIWADLTPSMEEIRHTRIYASTDYFDIAVDDDEEELECYDWEKELEMALLGHEAKRFLHAKGIVS
ncbi:MAG: hypothetical protein COB94_007560 [Gammaproteobacteria bacterium]|nr:hypothetical protein [Gammaproteobacteria bacterium]